MIDVFIGLAIFGMGIITGVAITCFMKNKAAVTAENEEDNVIIEPIAKKFYNIELAEDDNPEEEDKEAKKNRIEDRNFFS